MCSIAPHAQPPLSITTHRHSMWPLSSRFFWFERAASLGLRSPPVSNNTRGHKAAPAASNSQHCQHCSTTKHMFWTPVATPDIPHPLGSSGSNTAPLQALPHSKPHPQPPSRAIACTFPNTPYPAVFFAAQHMHSHSICNASWCAATASVELRTESVAASHLTTLPPTS